MVELFSEHTYAMDLSRDDADALGESRGVLDPTSGRAETGSSDETIEYINGVWSVPIESGCIRLIGPRARLEEFRGTAADRTFVRVERLRPHRGPLRAGMSSINSLNDFGATVAGEVEALEALGRIEIRFQLIVFKLVCGFDPEEPPELSDKLADGIVHGLTLRLVKAVVETGRMPGGFSLNLHNVHFWSDYYQLPRFLFAARQLGSRVGDTLLERTRE